MKKTFLLSAILFVILVSVFVYSACNKDQLTEGLEIKVDYDITDVAYNLSIVDANTGGIIEIPAKLSFTGTDKQFMIDVMGENLSTTTTNGGIFAFALKKTRILSENAPLDLKVEVSIEGYLTNSFELIAKDTGQFVQQLQMLKSEALPEGIEYTKATTLASNGVVLSEVVLKSPDGNYQVTVPKGIVLETSDGQKLQGEIKAEIHTFDAATPNVFQYYPGGLLSEVQLTNGNTQQGEFYSAGFIAIELTDAHGLKAHTLQNNQIDIATSFNLATLYNPITDRAAQPGDKIGLWSFDTHTSVWKEEGEVSILPDKKKTGHGFIKTSVKHLSYYNLDWHDRTLSFCSQMPSLTLTTNTPTNSKILVKTTIKRKSDGAYLHSMSNYIQLNTKTELKNVRKYPNPVTVEISSNGKVIGKIDLQSLCQPNIVIPVEVTIPSNITFSVVGKCTSKKVEIRPSLGFWYSKSGSNILQYTNVFNGRGVINAEIGAEYIFSTYYQGQKYTYRKVIEKTSYNKEIEIPAWICAKL